MTETILQALKALDDKITGMDTKVDALALQGAVIVERVGNLKATVDNHLAADEQTHGKQGERLNTLEHWRTSWVSKAASLAATIAVVISVAVGVTVAFIKDAIAGN